MLFLTLSSSTLLFNSSCLADFPVFKRLLPVKRIDKNWVRNKQSVETEKSKREIIYKKKIHSRLVNMMSARWQVQDEVTKKRCFRTESKTLVKITVTKFSVFYGS